MSAGRRSGPAPIMCTPSSLSSTTAPRVPLPSTPTTTGACHQRHGADGSGACACEEAARAPRPRGWRGRAAGRAEREHRAIVEFVARSRHRLPIGRKSRPCRGYSSSSIEERKVTYCRFDARASTLRAEGRRLSVEGGAPATGLRARHGGGGAEARANGGANRRFATRRRLIRHANGRHARPARGVPAWPSVCGASPEAKATSAAPPPLR